MDQNDPKCPQCWVNDRVGPRIRASSQERRPHPFERRAFLWKEALAHHCDPQTAPTKGSPLYCVEHSMAMVLPGLLTTQKRPLGLRLVLVGCGGHAASLQHRPRWDWATTLRGKSGHISSPEPPVALDILIHLTLMESY